MNRPDPKLRPFTRDVVLIGGTRDGERQHIQDGVPWLRFHKRIKCTPMDYPLTKHDTATDVDEEIYERKEFRDLSSAVNVFYVLAGEKDPLRLLLDGYRVAHKAGEQIA